MEAFSVEEGYCAQGNLTGNRNPYGSMMLRPYGTRLDKLKAAQHIQHFNISSLITLDSDNVKTTGKLLMIED